jgi:hypothetical protein
LLLDGEYFVRKKSTKVEAVALCPSEASAVIEPRIAEKIYAGLAKRKQTFAYGKALNGPRGRRGTRRYVGASVPDRHLSETGWFWPSSTPVCEELRRILR